MTELSQETLERFRHIRVIGLGGIGSSLLADLLRFVNYSLREVISEVGLIDGKQVKERNLERQSFVGADVGIAKTDALRDKYETEFIDILIESTPAYVTEDNIAGLIQDGSVIFMGVDNNKTRLMLSKYCRDELDNVILISGGNELTDGNVQLFVKVDGEVLTENKDALEERHPDISEPGDKHPDEMTCEELEVAEPQIVFTNRTVATLMLNAFAMIFREHQLPHYDEVWFDTKVNQAKPVQAEPVPADVFDAPEGRQE